MKLTKTISKRFLKVTVITNNFTIGFLLSIRVKRWKTYSILSSALFHFPWFQSLVANYIVKPFSEESVEIIHRFSIVHHSDQQTEISLASYCLTHKPSLHIVSILSTQLLIPHPRYTFKLLPWFSNQLGWQRSHTADVQVTWLTEPSAMSQCPHCSLDVICLHRHWLYHLTSSQGNGEEYSPIKCSRRGHIQTSLLLEV